MIVQLEADKDKQHQRHAVRERNKIFVENFHNFSRNSGCRTKKSVRMLTTIICVHRKIFTKIADSRKVRQ